MSLSFAGGKIIYVDMIVREVYSKSILSKSKVFDYAVNAYVGCQHGCLYCYARFMKRYSRHKEPWGEFVDVKVNAANLLQQEIRKFLPGRVWVSGVCDPYQPLEKKYELTRRCLEILFQHHWPVTVQTKSALVLRDLELLRDARDVEVGLTVTTADERVRKLFEPNAPPIEQRIEALEELHGAGIRTYAMIAPILSGAEELVHRLYGKVDYVLIDRMNYHYADWVYKEYDLESTESHEFFFQTAKELFTAFSKAGIECQILF